MLVDCPACRKSNDATLGAMCARCGADLGRLQAILGSASGRLAAAAEQLRRGDFAAALDHAELAWRLRHSNEAARLAYIAAVALRDPARIASWQSRAASSET